MSQQYKAEPMRVDMPEDMRRFVLDQVEKPLTESLNDPSRVAKLEPIVTSTANALKQKYGGVWQVVILNGSYSAFSAYIPQRLFHFKIGGFVVLVWQSLDY